MVATRRGARTDHTEEPEKEAPSLALRKKPVRRATAATTAKAAPKTRATRSKKAEPEQEPETAPSQQIEETPTESEPTTTRATRSRRAETVEPEPSKQKQEAKKPAAPAKRATRAAPANTTVTASKSQQAPAAPPSKPTLAARPARQTRAKTPAAQPPLSPKKITQVSRPRTRGIQATQDEKPKPVTRTRGASAVQASRTIRKRAVSDENAEIPELAPTQPRNEPAVSEAFPAHDSPLKAAPVEKEEDEEQEETGEEEEEQAVASLGKTTPPKSPGREVEQLEDHEQGVVDAVEVEHSDEDSEGHESSASDDELCGPKTPMRRTHKSQSRYHTSAQKSNPRDYPDVPLHTPPRRYGAQGIVRPTPQTQKPHTEIMGRDSVARPMTIGRADQRPFDFRRLKEDAGSLSKPVAPVVAQATEDVTQDAKGEEPVEVSASASLPNTHHDVDMVDSEAGDVGQAGSTNGMVIPLPHFEDLDETIVADENEMNKAEQAGVFSSPTEHPPAMSYEAEDSIMEDESSLIEPPVNQYEHDESMLDLGSPTVDPPVASYELDDDGSVIIHARDDGDSDAPSDDEDDYQDGFTEFGLKTPRPETIPWQNIREDQTIPVDFDMHFADVRSPARAQDDLAFGAAMDFSNLQLSDASMVSNEQLVNEAPDATVNLNDFIDMAALAEPTLQLDSYVPTSEGGVSLEAQQGDIPVDEESVNEESANEDSVIITRPEPAEPSSAAPKSEDEQIALAPIPAETPSRVPSEFGTTTPVQSQNLTVWGTNAPDQAADDVLEEVDFEIMPHYALPTLSSRRKSLPALGNQTPLRSSSRPVTSDGAGIAGVVQGFRQSPWVNVRRPYMVEHAGVDTPTALVCPSTVSPNKRKSSGVGQDISSPLAFKTPCTVGLNERFPQRAPKTGYSYQAQSAAVPTRFQTPGHPPVRYPATVQKLASQQEQRANSTPSVVPSTARSVTVTPALARRPSRSGSTHQPQTVAAPLRFSTPSAAPVQRPATIQKLASQTPKAATTPSVGMPQERFPRRSAKETYEEPAVTPEERFPRRSARQTYDEHASTVAAPARFHTPIQGKPKRPATVQRLTSQGSSKARTPSQARDSEATPRKSAAQTPLAATTPDATTPSTVAPSQATPKARFPRLPPKQEYEEHTDPASVPAPATPQARFPRLPSKKAYDEHARTVAGPSRFQSPAKASPRRPATSQKPVNLRKVALKSSAPSGSHTPVKTPLKPAAMTPSQVPMTPHPGAPLRGVLALVEVYTLDGASASAPFVSLLQRLGAKTTKSWSERVTHVIFKDGSPTTLQRVRLNNKQVNETGKGFMIHCVNSRWVSDCDASGSRVDEDDDAYAVDVTEVPRGGSRRRKSMEPSALVNIGGNIVRDRKSSVGRQSMGRNALSRQSMKLDTPARDLEDDITFTPVAGLEGLDDENDYEDGESELSTPDYLNAPDKLVQMTAPMNRVRKLDIKQDEGKNRRLTFWNGGA